MDCLLFGRPGEAYNIGTGAGMDNMQALELLETVFTTRFSGVNRQAPRPFDVNSNVLDHTKLTSLNGWRPTYNVRSGLETLKRQLE